MLPSSGALYLAKRTRRRPLLHMLQRSRSLAEEIPGELEAEEVAGEDLVAVVPLCVAVEALPEGVLLTVAVPGLRVLILLLPMSHLLLQPISTMPLVLLTRHSNPLPQSSRMV